ncbi:protein of unknown function [Candidatus Nitrosocaldus cavascurensis]|uniref:Uncharacterized protein n=1 Tax=Candidatus Nitrosocaldus cavascurensis TaxID=2058097 RepID=A0A2K5ATE4_9ARCH|nr:protein of unknown function [Candidatus Nitrosocaldus cavascurensis]
MYTSLNIGGELLVSRTISSKVSTVMENILNSSSLLLTMYISHIRNI